MNRNSLLISSALAMSCMPFGTFGNEIPLRMYDFGEMAKTIKPWGDTTNSRYYKRPKDKATLKRRAANKKARKARKTRG